MLFHDDALLVVNKPSGLLVHRGWGDDKVTAVDLARELVSGDVHPVHRLDRGTSGVLVFARDAAGAAHVQAQLQGEGHAAKRYLALVRGRAPEDVVVDHPIPRREGGERVPAVTHVRCVWSNGAVSWVLAMPKTGRLHQVRRHLKHLSHPLVGDVNYGKGPLNRLFREQYGFGRLALHAVSLGLVHPRTGDVMTLVAPLPPELTKLLLALEVPLEKHKGHGAFT